MKKKGLLPTPDGLTLDQISQRFSTDEKARQYFEAVRWESGWFCPHCGNANEDRIYAIKVNAKSKVRAGLYECAECKKQFTVTVGTIFEDSHIPLRKWLIAWYMLCASKKGISALQMQRMLGLGSYRSAWFMMHRIRYALQQPAFKRPMQGTIEADETWIGGKAPGVGAGNYRPNKTAVMSLVQRGGKVRSKVIGRVTAKNVAQFVSRNVHSSAKLMTDENHAYDSVGRYYKSHETVNHTRGEYVRGNVSTNTVEGYFANLKRGLNGVYHHVDQKYLPLYLAEFDFRYNERETTDGARTNEGVKKVSGKRLTLVRPTGKE
jgi:transposase-like protein